MNTELLIKTRNYIQANPEELAMQSWDCGSTACIGGLACRLAGRPITMIMMGRYTQLHHARTVLELDLVQARDLFFLDSWPTDLRYRYESADEEGTAAAIAVERIDRFIEQNSVAVS
jgi:hypothetical protein